MSEGIVDGGHDGVQQDKVSCADWLEVFVVPSLYSCFALIVL